MSRKFMKNYPSYFYYDKLDGNGIHGYLKTGVKNGRTAENFK